MDRFISAEFLRVFRIGNLDEPLAIEQLRIHRCATFLGPRAAIGGKLRLAHFQGHLLASLESGNIEPADPWDHSMPWFIERGEHGCVEQTIAIAVACVGILDGFFDARPKALKHLIVGVRLMRTQHAKDHAAVTVDRAVPTDFTTIRHRAIRLEAKAIPHALDHILFQFRKKPRMGLSIVPDVVWMSGATANAFVGVKASVSKTVASRRGQCIQRNHGSLQKPIRQRGVVPSFIPQPGCFIETIGIRDDVARHLRRILEAFSETMACLRTFDGFDRIRKMPCNHKRGLAE